MFTGIGDDSNMPTTYLTNVDISKDGVSILELMVMCGLTTSKSEARRLIQQGGVSIDDNKVNEIDMVISKEKLSKGVKIRKGKKVFHRALIKP